jgi:hypothetical protein
LPYEPPFEFAPALRRIFCAEENSDKLGFCPVQIGQVNIEVQAGKLGFMILIVKYGILSHHDTKFLRYLRDERTVFTGEGEGKLESLSGVAHTAFLPRKRYVEKGKCMGKVGCFIRLDERQEMHAA